MVEEKEEPRSEATDKVVFMIVGEVCMIVGEAFMIVGEFVITASFKDWPDLRSGDVLRDLAAISYSTLIRVYYN